MKKAKLTPNLPSNTMDIRSEFGFFDENDTFLNCLIDLLSVLNELSLILIGEYLFFVAKNTG